MPLSLRDEPLTRQHRFGVKIYDLNGKEANNQKIELDLDDDTDPTGLSPYRYKKAKAFVLDIPFPIFAV